MYVLVAKAEKLAIHYDFISFDCEQLTVGYSSENNIDWSHQAPLLFHFLFVGHGVGDVDGATGRSYMNYYFKCCDLCIPGAGTFLEACIQY